MANLQAPRKKYKGDVCIAKEFTRARAAVERVAYEDIRVTGDINVTIHPNHTKSELYPCAVDRDPVALPTDIVVSTADGAVRLGDMYHFTTRGKAVVSADFEDIKKSDRGTLRVYLDVTHQSCVVYTVGEDADLHHHGTCVVSSNFIQPTSGAPIEEPAVRRPGCTELKLENGDLGYIEVEGSLFVDYYIRPSPPGFKQQKLWYSVKKDNAEEWFQPPADVKTIKENHLLAQPGDFTVSRDGVSVLVAGTLDRAHCAGPGWVYLGKHTGPEEYRINTVIVID